MNIFNILLLLLFFIKSYYSQNILTALSQDLRISKFYNIIKDYQNVFSRPYLCVLAPSNDAFTAATFTPSPNFVYKHLFLGSVNFVPTPCLLDSWNKYSQVKTRTETVYTIKSISNTPFYITNITSPPPLINGAQVTVPDQASGNQVYHIIDRMLPDSILSEFQMELKNNPLYAQTNTMWQNMITAFNGQKFANSTFNSVFLSLADTQPGTVLIPSNDAWNSLADADKTRLTDPNLLSPVMARHYIPNRIMFLHNQPLWFQAGFSVNPSISDVNNINGAYYKSFNTDMISVQGFVATVIAANIPFDGGIIHIIGSTMAVSETRNTYLQRRAPSFYAMISNDPDLMKVLAGNNTVLAINEATMAAVNKLDPVTRKQMLLNCFIIGIVTMANSNNAIMSTAGNTTVRVTVTSSGTFIDTVSSLEEKTYVNRARVTFPDDTVQGVNINIISGTVGYVQYSCSDMLTVLNRESYNAILNATGVPLGLGSPYTLFAPSNEGLMKLGLTGMTSNGTGLISTITTIAPMAASSPSNTSTIGFISSTTTSANAVSGTGTNTGPLANQRYLMQRMIIANRLVLALRSQGKFKAATMNYAAMQEMIDISIDANSVVTFGINEVMIPGPTFDGGFYCYSNDASLPDRRNLIYMVSDVLVTSKDRSQSVCVVAPCAGCVHGYVGALVVALGCVVGVYRGVL